MKHRGGRLARAAFPAKVVTRAVSDVPGDDPAVIGSGPTVPDPSTLARWPLVGVGALAALLDDRAAIRTLAAAMAVFRVVMSELITPRLVSIAIPASPVGGTVSRETRPPSLR